MGDRGLRASADVGDAPEDTASPSAERLPLQARAARRAHRSRPARIGAADDQGAGGADRQGQGALAEGDQQQGGQQRRGIGEGAQRADVAALHPMVPDEEGQADRPQAQPRHRRPAGGVRHHRLFQRQMAQQRQQGGAAAEPADRLGRHRADPPAQHRIAGPDHRRQHRGAVAQGEARVEGHPASPDQHDDAEQPQRRPGDVPPAQPLARQQGGEQHDQQRPGVVDQVGLDRRREAQRHEEDEVIAEQPADAEQPDRRPLPGRGQRRAALQRHPAEPDQEGDGEGHAGQLERRDRAGPGGQQGQRRPHQHGGAADQRGAPDGGKVGGHGRLADKGGATWRGRRLRRPAFAGNDGKDGPTTVAAPGYAHSPGGPHQVAIDHQRARPG